MKGADGFILYGDFCFLTSMCSCFSKDVVSFNEAVLQKQSEM